MHFLYKRQVNRFCIKRFCKYCRFCKDLQSYQNFISSIVDSIYLYLAFDFDSLVYSIQQVFNIVHSITSKPIGFSRLQAMTSLRGYFLICLYVCVCVCERDWAGLVVVGTWKQWVTTLYMFVSIMRSIGVKTLWLRSFAMI